MRVKETISLAILLAGCATAAVAQDERWKIVRIEDGIFTGTMSGNRAARLDIADRGSIYHNLPGDLVRGSGRLLRQARPVAPFTRIRAEDAANVEIAIGPRMSVEVETDDNLSTKIVTEVEDGTLRIGTTGSFATNHAPVVRIVTPSLESLSLSGSGKGFIRGLNGGSFEMTSIGSGEFRAEGRLDRIRLTLSGSGSADLTGLRTSLVSIQLNGSGRADVGAPHTLSAMVNGSGEVTYRGNIQVMNAQVNGTGRVRERRN